MSEENGSIQPSALPGHTPGNLEALSNGSPGSEAFRTVRHDAEEFGTIPQVSERRENHTLTVRETARMFEAAGVARTERSIVNWCQRNALGAAKLDAYFDPNERKYFITPQSVEQAIAEEKAKADKQHPEAEGFGNIPHPTEASPRPAAGETVASTSELEALEAEVFDLKITNRAKDLY